MKDLLLFVFAILIYFSLACVFNRILKMWFLSKAPESSTVRSTKIIAGFMTIFSLVAVVLLKKAPLMLPGPYVGLVLSMLLAGERHGPGDPYSWSLIAAPINFFFYYWVVRIVAKYFPSIF
jgi:hypothetical protein